VVGSEGKGSTSPLKGIVLGGAIIIQDFKGRVGVLRLVMGNLKDFKVPDEVIDLYEDDSVIISVGIISQFGDKVRGPVGSVSSPVSSLNFPVPGVSDLDEIIIGTGRVHVDDLDD